MPGVPACSDDPTAGEQVPPPTRAGRMDGAGHELLADVLASLPAHTAVLSAEGRVLTVNDAWQRFGTDNRPG